MTAMATFDWTQPAEAPGSFAPKIPAGRHKVRIERVLHENKDGEGFATKDGDPSMMVIFADAQGREAAQYIPLVSDPAKAWALLAIFQAVDPPANLAKMREAGVTPESFRDPRFAQKQLVNRQLTVDVTHNVKGEKTYVNLAFVPPGGGANAGAGTADVGQIPF